MSTPVILDGANFRKWKDSYSLFVGVIQVEFDRFCKHIGTVVAGIDSFDVNLAI